MRERTGQAVPPSDLSDRGQDAPAGEAIPSRGLRVHLLGRLALAWNEADLSTPRSATTRSLLAYLALHHDRPLSRHLLAGTFWPERPDAAARKALSNALWQIRHALGPAADRLLAEPETVCFVLHPGDWLDLDAFAHRLRRCRQRPAGEAPADPAWSAYLADLEAARSLYRADLLVDCYDDWALLEREPLREAYLWILEQLLTCHKQRGDYERALLCAHQLVAADPLRETVHRELMRLYHLLDRHRAALEQYDTCCRLLREELGSEPAAATTALYHHIAAAIAEPGPLHLPAAPPPPLLRDPARPPFTGRAEERAALLGALQAAAHGQGGLALLEGAAGVGKTRLIEEIAADARWRRFQVGQGKADPLAASAPYQPLRHALLPLLTPLRLAQLAQLLEPIWLSASVPLFPTIATHLPDLPPLAPLEPQQEQQRLWEGLAQCLAGLASVAPLLLVLEDLHWADRATLAALDYLAPRLPAQRTLLLLSCRTAEARERPAVWKAIETLDRAQPLLRIELPPLAPQETTALVLRALGTTADNPSAAAFAQAVQDRTAGNALYTVELLKSLLEQGTLAASPGSGWSFPHPSDALPAPPSLAELVGQRLLRLPPAQRAVLELAAVLGEDAEYAPLAAASPAPPDALTAALGELRRRGFLVETETAYRFEHDLVRETTYRAIPARRRQSLHRHAGRALESSHADRVEALAHHAAGGGEWERAARYYQAAGARAADMGATAGAAAAYGRALEALDRLPGPADPAWRFTLLLARERANDLQGEREAQRQDLDCLEALLADWTEATAGQHAEVLLRRAEYHTTTSDYPAAIQAAQDALGWTTSEGDPALAVQGFLAWGRGFWRQGDYAQARQRYEQALSMAQAGGDPDGEANSLLNLGNVFLYQGSYDQARAYYEQSLSLYQQLGRRKNEGNARHNLGLTADLQGNYDEAKTYYEQSLHIYQEIGFRRGQGHTLNNLGTILRCQGHLVEAQECFEQSRQIFQQIGDREGEGSALANLGTCYEDCGDYARARSYYLQSLEQHEQLGYRRGIGATLVFLAMSSHRLGDDQAALDYARRALDMAEEMGERQLQGDGFLRRGYALEGLGHLARADAAYRQALEIRRELGDPNQYPEPLAALARIALAQGDIPQSAACAEETLRYLEQDSFSHAENILLVYLSCYRALQANLDPRSLAVLTRAYHLLQERAATIDDPEVRRSFDAIPAHRDIVALYEVLQAQARGRQVPFRLPRAEAPTGRPLRDDEYVTVVWTVEAPADQQIAPKIGRRRHRLLRLLREAAEQGAAPTVDDLAAALAASRATLKRDLEALRRAGHPVRTRGSH